MSRLCTVVEGWTERLGPFTLKSGGTAVDLTGFTVDLFLRAGRSGTLEETAGNVTVDADPATGKVYFKPDSVDFKADRSPYELHFRVTDPFGDVVFFPNGAPDTIEVYRP